MYLRVWTTKCRSPGVYGKFLNNYCMAHYFQSKIVTCLSMAQCKTSVGSNDTASKGSPWCLSTSFVQLSTQFLITSLPGQVWSTQRNLQSWSQNSVFEMNYTRMDECAEMPVMFVKCQPDIEQCPVGALHSDWTLFFCWNHSVCQVWWRVHLSLSSIHILPRCCPKFHKLLEL